MSDPESSAPEPSAPEPSVPDPRIARIHQALESGRIGAASAAAQALVAEAETEELRLKAHALAGMCHFHLGQYEAAVDHFERTARGMPSRPAWFRVALAHTLGRQAEAGAEAFAQAVACEGDDAVSRELTVPFMRFDYAGALVSAGELDRALVQLAHLERLYVELDRTDDAHVLAKGIPLIDHVINLVLEVFDQRKQPAQARRWAREFAKGLDAHGRKRLDEVGRTRKGLQHMVRGGR